jgi:putative spermidine/putrescine transport system substrate-binding protein
MTPRRVPPIRLSRRHVLKTGALALAGAAAARPFRLATAQARTSVPGERELYVLTWGGPLAAVQRKAHIPAFEQAHDCKVTLTEGQIMSATMVAQKHDPQFDVFYDNTLFIPRYRDEGIYAKVTEAEIPRLKELHPKYRQIGQDLITPMWVHAMTVVYNEKKVKPPTSLDDLLRPEYRGKVAFQKPPDAVLFMPMIMAHTGATFDNPEPAFAWIEKAMPNVLTHYATVPQMAQLLEREEVWIGLWYSGRATEMRRRGLPIASFSPPSGAIPVINGPAVSLKARHPRLARAWVNHVLDPAMQVELTRATFFGPTNRNTRLPADLAQAVIDEPHEIDGLLTVDWARLTARQDEWTQRYNKILAAAR